MRPFYVLLEAVLPSEAGPTLVTSEGVQPFVNLLAVKLSCAEIVEPLVAEIALEGRRIRVVTLMIAEGLLSLESGRTLVTGKGLFLGVGDHVDWHFELFEERFGANWTGIGFGGRVQFLVVPE